MVPGAVNHYLGKGLIAYNGLGPKELDMAAVHVRSSCSRVPLRREDRGLLSPST